MQRSFRLQRTAAANPTFRSEKRGWMSEMQHRFRSGQTDVADSTSRQVEALPDVGNAELVLPSANRCCKSDVRDWKTTLNVGNAALIAPLENCCCKFDIRAKGGAVVGRSAGREVVMCRRVAHLPLKTGRCFNGSVRKFVTMWQLRCTGGMETRMGGWGSQLARAGLLSSPS